MKPFLRTNLGIELFLVVGGLIWVIAGAAAFVHLAGAPAMDGLRMACALGVFGISSLAFLALEIRRASERKITLKIRSHRNFQRSRNLRPSFASGRSVGIRNLQRDRRADSTRRRNAIDFGSPASPSHSAVPGH